MGKQFEYHSRGDDARSIAPTLDDAPFIRASRDSAAVSRRLSPLARARRGGDFPLYVYVNARAFRGCLRVVVGIAVEFTIGNPSV